MEQDHKNPARLISEIEFEHGFEYGTLASRKRSRLVSKVRRDAILQMRNMGMSWHEIGRMLDRDHTTVCQIIVGSVEKVGDNKGKSKGAMRGKPGNKRRR